MKYTPYLSSKFKEFYAEIFFDYPIENIPKDFLYWRMKPAHHTP
jgi:hypothetical protein